MAEIRTEFAGIIKRHLDQAVHDGMIDPLDTEIAAWAWFGSLNEVITHWLLSGRPERLEDAYAALRLLLNQHPSGKRSRMFQGIQPDVAISFMKKIADAESAAR